MASYFSCWMLAYMALFDRPCQDRGRCLRGVGGGISIPSGMASPVPVISSLGIIYKLFR